MSTDRRPIIKDDRVRLSLPWRCVLRGKLNQILNFKLTKTRIILYRFSSIVDATSDERFEV